jgi:hypothetical protein
MDSANSQVLPSPPSLMKSLMAGFDAVGNHVSVVLFSMCLDFFLWFGPRLRLVKVLQPLFNQTAVMPELQNPETIKALQAGVEEINLFSVLRTFPVGIPSLMAGRPILKLPIGNQLTWDLSSYKSTIVVWLFLLLIGLVIGTLYFSVVAQAAIVGKVSLRLAMKEWLWTSTQVLLLTIFCLVLCMMLIVPFSCLFTLLFMSGLGIEQLSLLSILIAGGFLVWLIIPLFFSPHGIFVNRRSVWNSLMDSIHLARLTFATTGLLLLVILIISEGLNVLWNMPPADSWFVFVGIAGHAFISASLLAASFVYYRDALSWIHQVIQKTKLSVA